MVENRMGDNRGVSIQAGSINGPVNVNFAPAAPFPGWMDTARRVRDCDPGELGAHHSIPGSEDKGLPPTWPGTWTTDSTGA
ncbi:hypothetical protein [Nocardiopsis sp. MG754419]|uniref:hypothetical protein n=1 Tax=Nocardiopsis sp. MG754419 TaxID=2259865 RepID=UPI001BAAAB5B|nr:hypothetical protein [Nocardiopsis sp. MG754419]